MDANKLEADPTISRQAVQEEGPTQASLKPDPSTKRQTEASRRTDAEKIESRPFERKADMKTDRYNPEDLYEQN